jgi:hypothetical protein
MPHSANLAAIIEKAVADVLDSNLPRLRSEIVQRASADLQNFSGAGNSALGEQISAALAGIQDAASQAEILKKLLEGAAQFAPRVALFVVRAGLVTGWQSLGFDDNEAISGTNLATSSPLVARAMRDRNTAEGPAADFEASLIKKLKPPFDGRCAVLPLVVKDKVAALLYADAGSSAGNSLASAPLSSLMRFAGVWLELNALRKSEHIPGDEPQAGVPAAPEVVPVPTVASERSVENDSEITKKARRFAKLLVEEIKLYNQSKVTEGREKRDLYERLREDIEKSRATYEKRYGQSLAASGEYFNQELVRILADNDIKLMGNNFPQ